MIEAILISWAAIGITIPIVKVVGVIDKTISRKKQGRGTGARDIINDVREMNSAESQAYETVATALCGGEKAPKLLRKSTEIAMKGLTSYATPGIKDVVGKNK